MSQQNNTIPQDATKQQQEKKTPWYASFGAGICSPFLVMFFGLVFLLATGDADKVDEGEWWRAAIITAACALTGWFHSYKLCGIHKYYAGFWLAVTIIFCAVQIFSTGLSF